MERFFSFATKVVFLIIIVVSCEKEPCFDGDAWKINNEMTQKWFVPDSLNTSTIVDENGIAQTLSQFGKGTWKTEGIVEDDCDVLYSSTGFSIQYSTSIQPYYFSININSGGANEDDFTFFFRTSRTDNQFIRDGKYNFVQKKVVDDNVGVIELEDALVGSTVYQKVLQVNILGNLEVNDVEGFSYAQGYGLIQIRTKGGGKYTVID